MSELEDRKKMLVAECEVYREMLKLEAHNLRLYVEKTKRRLSSAGTASRLTLGVASWLTGKPKFGWRAVVTLALIGWQWYRSRSKDDDRSSGGLRSIVTAAQEFLGRKL